MKGAAGALAALLACGAGLVACSGPIERRVVHCNDPGRQALRSGPALVGHAYGMQSSPIPLDAVQFTDASLWERIAVQHLSAARNAANTVEVAARLVNCTDSTQVIGLRSSFMDGAQRPTEPASAWQTVHLQPRSTATYTESSTSTQARHYLLEVRPIR